MPVIAALQGHVTLVGHNPVKLDLLSYGRLVFAEFVGNGGLGLVIIYSLFDDLSVLKGKVWIRITTHKYHQSFHGQLPELLL